MTAGRKTRLQALGDEQVSSDEVALATCCAMVRFVGKISSAMAKLVEPLGLTLSSFEVLVNLDGRDGICQQQLCDRLLFTKGNICVIVHKLEQAGFVTRKADPEDGRAYRLYVTDVGRELLAKLRPARVQLIEQALSGLAPDEQQVLQDLISRATDSLVTLTSNATCKDTQFDWQGPLSD